MSSNKDDNYSEFRLLAVEQFTKDEVDVIDKAYNLANEAHYGQLRYSGQPYISHPLAVAKILIDLGMDPQSIVVAILHDTVEDTAIALDKIKELFGEEIAMLVDGVTKLGKVPLSTKAEQQAENLRKMLIAMSVDIRVIIIKLADRLHNMRTLDFMRPQKRRDKALETLEIYAPIAHRLGIRAIKEELEDLSISYLDPVAYEEISNTLKDSSETHMNFVDDVIKKIHKRIDPYVPGAYIDGRTKSIHGIYRKMYIQNRNFDQIYDIYAIRIIVETVIDCYNCLGIIHDMFHSLPGRFKDYISMPKSNMYQSLHTTVIGEDGIPFEVQIRTWEMHYTAEYGIAAHWKYKLGVNDNSKFEERLMWIRQLLESQSDPDDVEEIIRTIKSDFVPDDVFVFTPKGDVINVPTGSTVIDFAYAIHSEVGHRMVGAKVDGKIVPLDYKVSTGQIIEVLTSSQQGKGPSRDWIKIVATSSARNKIRNWFKKERRPENITEGKAEIEHEFKRNNIRLEGDILLEFIKKLADKQHCKDIDDFYAAIGYGNISINRMMPYIKEEYYKIVKSSDITQINITPEKRVRSSEGVVVEGVDNVLIKFSRCCNPLPGDDIIGFITRGHGVSIHKRDCSNVPNSIPLADEPERWINVTWDENIKEEFKSTLTLEGLDRIGLIADISSQLAGMHVMIHFLNSRIVKSGKCIITLTITVNGVEHLNSVIRRLEKISDVLNIERSGV
ncbi:MAG: bifunctional (p)ppGpp synthetase/guanosine-3',5'-bis(diphosphate) 3'-pyrophosphohydrolase [Oscillospiraceae bacterium]|jgi:GTP pyrophosphokinase|nr:bifunctional (p)ppGpp synthetase/guanosine-3',5'-bis(diphosphate) 3'-pyrophosphohydrolase [Oscillospiraceae bacterium]